MMVLRVSSGVAHVEAGDLKNMFLASSINIR